MSSLLKYLNIFDAKSYHKWCLENHPDKRPGDPDATRKFQEVSAAWASSQTAASAPHRAEPSTSSSRAPPAAAAAFGATKLLREQHVRQKCSKTGIRGTRLGWCYRNKQHNSVYCFYHEPNTDNLKYAYSTDPVKMFGPFCMFEKPNIFAPERTNKTCKTKCVNGNWCTKTSMHGKDYCNTHDPNAETCQQTTKSGKPCTRKAIKGQIFCGQHKPVV